ncbi:MAG: kynureninase [Gemmatimonadaceae bacterium]|nr:kynureninase [Gemmatimonadaceae bacterium]
MTTVATPAELEQLDATDPLAPVRERFTLPDGVIYLDGNSLGALPRATAERLSQVVHAEWGRDLITSWNANGWFTAPQRVGGKIAALVGAAPHEVLVADSTSVNLFKAIVAALALRPGRRTVLSEPGNFPTDLYMIESALRTLGAGYRLHLVERTALADAMDDDTALVLLTHVHYKTAEQFDMAAITQAAHRVGALTCWDLSHSAGAVPVDLRAATADFAVGCGYKYLNGGPGAPAFLFVAERHQDAAQSPLGGWMGHAQPFAFDDAYAPAPGITRFACGTPPILSLAALECGVDELLAVDRAALFAKGRSLVALFAERVLAGTAADGVSLVGPPPDHPRGSHVSFAHAHAYEIVQALIARGVIGDFRAPDVMRFGITPLYLGWGDVARAADAVVEVVLSGAWRDPRFAARQAVT